MLLFYVPTVLLLLKGHHARPVLHHTSPMSNETSSWIDDFAFLNAVHPAPQRALFSVVWSCILTVFVCAWTSVHPNVPPQGRRRGLITRMKMMFWTIVTPELVLAWAVRQWFAAREIRDAFNDSFRGSQQSRRWTTAHGHSLTMGGFKLVNEEIKNVKEPPYPGWISTSEDWGRYYEYRYQLDSLRSELGPLTMEQFKLLLKDPKFEFPSITAAEIEDRSKGDSLSKLIAIVQTSWFITQCIARGFQGLALTELELVTLAMASLNAITFIFWWSKPLGVQEPVKVSIPPELLEGKFMGKESLPGDPGDNYDFPASRIITEISIEFKRAINFLFHPLAWYPDLPLSMLLRAYFLRLPYRLFYVLTCPVFLFFPLGTLFLLKIIKTKNVGKNEGNGTVATRVILALRRLRYNLSYSIRRYFGGEAGTLHQIASCSYGYYPFTLNWFFIFPVSFFLLVIILVLLSPLFALFSVASFVFTVTFEIITTNTVPAGSSHVPSFYAPRTNSDRYSRMIVFAIFGVIFGGIHCIGWNFTFPTHLQNGQCGDVLHWFSASSPSSQPQLTTS